MCCFRGYARCAAPRWGLREDDLCEACHDALADHFVQDYCRGCGSTVGPYAAADDRCSSCRDRPSPIAKVVRLGAHEGLLRDLLLAFKFRGRGEVGEFLGRELMATLRQADWFGEVEALTAVPTCWHRHLTRRPYAATTLARRVAGLAGLPCPGLLHRVKGGPSQIGLTYAERVQNVRGAFRMARGVTLDGAVVCLVDDVATTGATLAECARVLEKAGAAKVFAAVVCKQGGY